MTELRRFARTPLGHAVDFATKGLDFALRMDGVAKDISLGGMFILTDFPTRIGEDIVVYLTLPGGKHKMALPAIVRWARDDGMGVQFGQFGARDTHAIVEFMEQSVSGGPGGPGATSRGVEGDRNPRQPSEGVARAASLPGPPPANLAALGPNARRDAKAGRGRHRRRS
jgi:hypothetical protein